MAILGTRSERAYMVESRHSRVFTRGFEGLFPEVRDRIFLPESAMARLPPGVHAEPVEGIAEDNRSLLLPSMKAEIHPLVYTMEVKGIGARSPMYGFSSGHAMGPGDQHGGGSLKEHWAQKAHGPPAFTGESWFGSSPYGAQGEEACVDSARTSEEAALNGHPMNLNGFWICPVISYCRLPDWLTEAFSGEYWYRRYPGPWFQQFRLMPSDIRLYFHSEAAMGSSPHMVLGALEIDSGDTFDAFVDNYISSGMAALTLGARTLRTLGGEYRLLDYDDVWLDKDSVIAPNGVIHFADIDDLEWRVFRDRDGVIEKLKRQFERNHFEFMFGLDTLLSEGDRMFGRRPTMADRRRELASRTELALAGDGYITAETDGSGLTLVLRPGDASVGQVSIRFVDFQVKEAIG